MRSWVVIVSLVCGLAGCSGNQPSEMTSFDAFNTGMKYRKQGRIELSRQWLQKAIELDHGGMFSQQASVVIATQLPRFPISVEAEQRNAIGFNQLNRGQLDDAKKTFSELRRDFPRFEWPYLNLAMMHLRANELDKAEELLQEAIAINPNYLKGWSTMAQIKARKKDKEGFQKCVTKVRELESGKIEKLEESRI